jgi:hypothetical protein
MAVASAACFDHVVWRLPYKAVREKKEGHSIRVSPAFDFTESTAIKKNHSSTDTGC